jgi:putative hemolysin/putative flippase GtrA
VKRRFLEFVLSRGLGTVVDTLVLWALSHYLFSGGYLATYILSALLSFEAAVMSNFLCSYFWIWRERISHKTSATFWRHLLGFNLTALVGFVVKMLFLLLFERLFGWGVVVCNLAALGISGSLNFLLSDTVVFRRQTTPPCHKVLSEEELVPLSPLFRGRLGRLMGRFVIRLCGIDKLNHIYDAIYPFSGPEAARQALRLIGCRYEIGNPERLESLPEGPFITISNHPYGGIDGIILLDMLGPRRKDLRIMVNKILWRIEPMQSNFITVTPTETHKLKADATTLGGLRATLAHLRSGGVISLFPSGAVSDLHIPSGTIEDREWQEGIIRLVRRARVPIVPIHFEGRNSLFYYLLGLVDWRIRLLRLPREITNKHRGRHRLAIGPTISVAEQDNAGSIESLRSLLRSRVYDMPPAAYYTPVEGPEKEPLE